MSIVQLELNMSKFPYEITRVCPDTQAELDKNYEKDGNKCEYEVKEIKLNMAERYVEMGPNDHWKDAPNFMLAFELDTRYKNEGFIG